MSDYPSPSRKAISRYMIISFLTGSLDFLIALLLLHLGVAAAISLAVSIVIAGVADYFALEWWGFPGRRSRYSSTRLVESGVVEAGTYAIRVGVLWLWKRHMGDFEPTEHFIGLAVAYGVAFLFGYAIRTKIIFRNKSTRRLRMKR